MLLNRSYNLRDCIRLIETILKQCFLYFNEVTNLYLKVPYRGRANLTTHSKLMYGVYRLIYYNSPPLEIISQTIEIEVL